MVAGRKNTYWDILIFFHSVITEIQNIVGFLHLTEECVACLQNLHK